MEFIESKPDAISAFSGYIASYPNGEFRECNIIEDKNILGAMMIFKNCVVNGSSIINRELVIKHNIRYNEFFLWRGLFLFCRLLEIRIYKVKMKN